jgi:hypothetical protein
MSNSADARQRGLPIVRFVFAKTGSRREERVETQARVMTFSNFPGL